MSREQEEKEEMDVYSRLESRDLAGFLVAGSVADSRHLGPRSDFADGPFPGQKCRAEANKDNSRLIRKNRSETSLS